MSRWYNKQGDIVLGAGVRDARNQGLVPSVTTITGQLKNQYLTEWQLGKIAGICKEYPSYEWPELLDEYYRQMDLVMDSGTDMHKYLAGESTLCDPMLMQSIELFRAQHNLVPDVMEKRITWDGEYGFAGTIDCIGTLDGKQSIIDYKSQGKENLATYFDHAMQLAAYGLLWGDSFEMQYVNIVFSSSVKKYKVKIWDIDDVRRARSVFFDLCRIFYAVNRLGQWRP